MSLLDAWIAPAFRDPTGLRDALERCDHAHYAVADGFFRTDRLDALIEFHRRQAFAPDDVGLHYDSTATKPTAGADPACELFFSPEWHEYAAFVTGATLASPGATTVKLRRHPERAAGFWVHTDVGHQGARKAMAVLGYFNRGWRDADGGLLQLWRAFALDGEPEFRWDDYHGRRLDFLESATRLTITAVAPRGFLDLEMTLIDAIAPVYNRVVFCDFQRTPAFHSVTPSRDRAREGFIQWLF